MLCYKDKTFCCSKDCPVKNCVERITRYDLKKAKQLGLEISYFDLSCGCVEYHESLKKEMKGVQLDA